MNEAQAKQRLKEVIDVIAEHIEDEKCCEGFINNLLEDNLRIVTDNEENASEFLGIGRKRSFSVKPSNVFLNLHKSLSFCIETALTSDIPDTKIKLIKITLLALITLLRCTYVNVTDEMAKVAGFLYERQADVNPIEEKYCMEFYRNEIDSALKDYSKTVNDLADLKTIEIIEGKIKLIEKVEYFI